MNETTDYSGMFVYKDDHLDYILTSEGRMKWDDHDGLFHTEYFIKDHLGKVRTVLTIDPNRAFNAQQSDYYSFGLEIPLSGTSDNQLKYNGKFLDPETGLYYYGARYYDPQSSTWLSVDPLAEKYAGWTPYNYCVGNPVVFVDPDGRKIWIAGAEGTKIEYSQRMEYKGDKFVEKTIEAINKVYNSSGTAKKIIDEMVGSGFDFNIEQTLGGSNYAPDPKSTLVIPAGSDVGYNTPSGGTIKWNPEGANLYEQKSNNSVLSRTQKRPEIELFHELAHGFDNMYGTYGNGVFDRLDNNEWSAIHQENLIRCELDLPLRTYYSKNVFNGRPSPSGPKQIKKEEDEFISTYYYKKYGKRIAYKKNPAN